MNQPVNKDFYDEGIPLGQLLRVFYAKRVIIIGVSLAVGIIVAIGSLFLKNIYQSDSALIIQTPELKLTGEVAPLTPDMLLALVESTEVKKEVFNLAKEQKAIKPDMTFQDFQQLLSTTTERSKGVAPTLLPMIKLKAMTPDPESSKIIANLWSDVVMKKSNAIYTRGIADMSTFASGIYDKADSARNRAEIDLATRTVKANLDVEEKRLASVQLKSVSLAADLLDIEVKMAINERRIKEIRDRIQQQEIEGLWLGEILKKAYRHESAAPQIPDATIARQIDQRVKSLVSREDRLRQFEVESRMDFKRVELEKIGTLLSNAIAELDQASDELRVSRAKLASAKEQLALLPEKIVLNKAITDDALWTAYLQGDNPEGKGISSMKTEIENPIYLSVQNSIIAETTRIAGLSTKIDFLKTKIEMFSKEQAEKKAELNKLEVELATQKLGLLRDEQILDVLRKNYLNDQSNLENIYYDQETLKTLQDIKRKKFEDLSKENEFLSARVINDKRELDVLKRDVEKLSSVANSMASKAEEAAILQLSSEQASRSGVKILYLAEANPQKVKPKRSVIVLVSMFVTALLTMGVITFREMFQLETA